MNDRISLPEPRQAQRKMGRNEPCWCGSGRKWKICHRAREDAPRSNYFEAKLAARKAFSKEYCLHPMAPASCSGGIIRAHTIQRAEGLTAISEENHVFSVKDGINDLHKNRGRLNPKKTGTKIASTFSGFCNSHDTDLFRNIESGEIRTDSASAFCLHYRAICLEYYQKRSVFDATESLRSADRGENISRQSFVQNIADLYLVGASEAMNELDAAKAQLDRMYLSNKYSGLQMLRIDFDGQLPFAACCAFQPITTCSGEVVQDLMDRDLENVSLTVTSVGGKSCAFFCWVGSVEGPSSRLAESFAAISELDRPSVLFQLLLVSTENVHMRPSWWKSLTDLELAHAQTMMRSGVTPDGFGDTHRLLVPGLISTGLPTINSTALRL